VELHFLSKSRDGSVGIALGYGLDNWDSRVRFPGGGGGGEFFLLKTTSRTALGPIQPPIQWLPEALSLGVKRQVSEDNHSQTSSADVKE
jgi:hypothetical protein